MLLDDVVPEDRVAWRELTDAKSCPDGIGQGAACDPVMERLVRALLPEEEAVQMLRGFYSDMLQARLPNRLADLRGDTRVGGRLALRWINAHGVPMDSTSTALPRRR